MALITSDYAPSSAFSSQRPTGIGMDREVVSQLLDVRSLPGTWNASFNNGMMIKLRHCCGSTRGLQVRRPDSHDKQGMIVAPTTTPCFGN